MGADAKANSRLGGGGALELLEHAILLDAARDDDGRRDAEPLAGEVDLLRRFRALELVDLKSVTINTAKGGVCGVSAGADTKANTLELVRAPSSLLQRLQRGVALESLGESGSSFRAESVFRETASMGAGVGAEGCQWGLTQKQPLWGAAAHSRLEIIVSLRMAASAETPSSPMWLCWILQGMGRGTVRVQVRVSGR